MQVEGYPFLSSSRAFFFAFFSTFSRFNRRTNNLPCFRPKRFDVSFCFSSKQVDHQNQNNAFHIKKAFRRPCKNWKEVKKRLSLQTSLDEKRIFARNPSKQIETDSFFARVFEVLPDPSHVNWRHIRQFTVLHCSVSWVSLLTQRCFPRRNYFAALLFSKPVHIRGTLNELKSRSN